jgi:hypothetical protein
MPEMKSAKRIHASQSGELLETAAYMEKYHIASKNHGADFPDFALVFLVAYLKITPIFTADKADF